MLYRASDVSSAMLWGLFGLGWNVIIETPRHSLDGTQQARQPWQ